MKRIFTFFKELYHFFHDSEHLYLEVHQNDGRLLRENKDKFSITYIGHATCLIQIDGINILTDPHMAKYCWGFLFKRYSRPGIRKRHLPKIDLVLLSHAHFDHLNVRTLKRVCKKDTTIITEKTVLELLTDIPGKHIGKEWGDTVRYKHLMIHFVHVRHWGHRYIVDTHRKHTGFIIQGKNHTIFFPGDTAYFDGFRKIRRKYKPDIALLPVGDYLPRDVRHDVHLSPEEAILAVQELDVKTCIPIHWGTFKLSEDDMFTPIEELKKHMKKKHMENRFKILMHGETYWD